MSGTEQPQVSRRTALLAATVPGAAALAGCGADGTPGATDGSAAGIAATSADLRLLRRAAAREERVRTEARSASRRHRELRSALRVLVTVHSDHLELLARSLEEGSPPPGPRSPVARDPGAAAQDLARSERSVAAAHARAALEAKSGPFARVLAGMAAAADQQALLLEGLTPESRRP